MTEPNASTPKHRFRFQYRLRTLLLVVTIAALLCSIGTCIGWHLAILVLAIVGGIIAVTSSVELVRLLAAVVTGLLACLFVVLYDSYARIRFGFDHPGETLNYRPELGIFVAVYQHYAYAVPILGLLLGSFIIWRWPKSRFLIELIVHVL